MGLEVYKHLHSQLTSKKNIRPCRFWLNNWVVSGQSICQSVHVSLPWRNHCLALTQKGAIFAWGQNKANTWGTALTSTQHIRLSVSFQAASAPSCLSKAGQLGVDGFNIHAPLTELVRTFAPLLGLFGLFKTPYYGSLVVLVLMSGCKSSNTGEVLQWSGPNRTSCVFPC